MNMSTIARPAVRKLIESLDPAWEYAITRDLTAHEIFRTGHTVPASPIVFYDRESGRPANAVYGGRGNYIRVNKDDVRRLQAAVRNGQTPSVATFETVNSLNKQASSMPTFRSPQAVTATVKRLIRLQEISTASTVRTSRCANGKYLSAILLPDGVAETEYACIEKTLGDYGFAVNLHRDTGWIAATSLMPA
jgi:hypothetical protein